MVATGCGNDLDVKPLFNHQNGRIVIQTNQDLDGKQVYTQARRGKFDTIDCDALKASAKPLTGGEGTIDGPFVDPALTKPFYGPEWGQGNPTPEMIASIANGTDSIIDMCVYDGNDLVIKKERDLFAAWDDAKKAGLDGKADDPNSGEVRINSPEAYGQRCVDEMGEIPFFTKTGDQSYDTYSCLDSTEIPMTATDASGNVNHPESGTLAKCDKPQYIYSLCEAGPRVAERTNDQGTHWVLLCRKSIGGLHNDQYNDIAMIGHNPFTGKTCYFQNALYSKTDGGHVPHPADKEKSQNLWSGVHGGIGSGIECNRCHDADPFIHSPWIDGAKDGQGNPIIPKMGLDPDFPVGANDTPYSIVNLKGQGWTQEKQLVSAEANACLRCHRMGGGQWATGWLDRLQGTDTSWTSITTDVWNQPFHKFWMPTDVSFDTDTAWAGSDFAKALQFIRKCGSTPSDPSCIWKDIPQSLGEDTSGNGALRNPVNLSDDEVAKQATTLLGMNKNAPSQECAECHAPNTTTLHDWQEKTDTAVATCLSQTSGGMDHTDAFDDQHVGANEFKTFGPFDVAAGSKIEVHMTGTGDADLYVRRGDEVSTTNYDCRPYTGTSNEDCTGTQFNASGPAKFYVGVNGYADATVSIKVSYQIPGTGTKPASEVVDCLRLEPGHADSPYVPAKLGIYAAAAHLGWFQDTFKAAYPSGQNGNTDDTWALEYGKFKNRASMPKGNHPRLAQPDFDIVAEWFARGLPNLTSYIAPDTGPTSCTQSITSDVQAHASQMATAGWSAVNRNNSLRMYGCGTATNPKQCLTSLPDATSKSYGTGWNAVGTVRILRELSFNTYYWMRSSPDGRFVANGRTGGDGAAISDLQADKDISVKAAYDPGFFPDNRGWVFQGTPIGAGFCSMALLQSDPDKINFSETACNTVEGVSLYQHLGAGLGGGDYFVVNSQFTSDHPSAGETSDPSAAFGATATMKLTPMVYDGTHYTGKPQINLDTPFEGDTVLSPSTTLLVSRFGNETQQLGYVLRKVIATPTANSYTVTTQEVGRYCVQGAKPAISFDEHYMVVHHYVGPNDYAELGFASANDPTFKDMLQKGTSNIYLIDLTTGTHQRITNMHAGQYALYPHWRSDGWIYFLVRDHVTNKEYAAASDAALN
ncbi:MAG: PPC domain-containing protein [Kofleriaceae bacterium]